jgi:hypothetical protein
MTVTSPGQPPQTSSTQAIAALVLGLLSLICCGILGPIAWFLGSQELKAIAAGRSPAAGEGLAKVGMILGILGTVYLVLVTLWIFFMGGMAILSTFFSSMANH